MTPIEICRDAKTPASAMTEDITAFLPDGRQIELYSTEEGFETDTPVNSKTEFRKGEILPLRGGLVARAVEEKIEKPDKVPLFREVHYTIIKGEKGGTGGGQISGDIVKPAKKVNEKIINPGSKRK